MTWVRPVAGLVAGDVIANAPSFLAFVHMARSLGVSDCGAVEFRIAVSADFSLAADGGLETWAGEVARGRGPSDLVGRILPSAWSSRVSPSVPGGPPGRGSRAMLASTAFCSRTARRCSIVGGAGHFAVLFLLRTAPRRLRARVVGIQPL
jgi:hypothetical protein